MSAAKEVIHTVEQTLDAVEETLDVIENTPVPKRAKGALYLGASVAVLGVAAVSGFVGYKVAEKRLTAKYDEVLRQQVQEAKDFYARLYKKEGFETPEQATEALGVEVPEEGHIPPNRKAELAAQAAARYQGHDHAAVVEVVEPVETEVGVSVRATEDGKIEETVEVTNVFDRENRPIEDGFDWEEELAKRPELQAVGLPYVITHDEFMNNESGYEQTQLTWFEKDDTLIDNRDEIIDRVEHTIGEHNLSRFGHGSRDNKIVYIRNDKLSLDFEVVKDKGSYKEKVLGFIEHSDRRQLRRFRRGDDE